MILIVQSVTSIMTLVLVPRFLEEGDHPSFPTFGSHVHGHHSCPSPTFPTCGFDEMSQVQPF